MSESKSKVSTLRAIGRASLRLSGGQLTSRSAPDGPPIAPDLDANQITAAEVGAASPSSADIQDEARLLPARPARDLRGAFELPPLPQRRDRRRRAGLVSFVLLVALPIALATFYYVGVASDQYVAEFRFMVKDVSPTQNATAAQAASAVQSLLGAGGQSSSVIENYIAVDYLMSRQAVDELQKRIHVVSLYSRASTDAWARFNAALPIERFMLYWQRMNTASYDPMTGIASVQVRAFTPEDAKLIASTMVTLSEELINRINARMHIDAVKFSQKEVERGEARLKDIRARLTEFRNKTGVIDPTASLVASNSQLAQTLRANIAQLQTQLTASTSQHLGPNSPVVMTLRSQLKAAQDQLASVENAVAKNPQGTALSSAVAQFEQLDLERQFAQNMLTSAQQAYDQARATAAAQYLYVEPYVQPALPESAIYPKRLLSISMVALFAFVAWSILTLVMRSIREHYA